VTDHDAALRCDLTIAGCLRGIGVQARAVSGVTLTSDNSDIVTIQLVTKVSVDAKRTSDATTTPTATIIVQGPLVTTA
jgi:hypothetical protein